MWMNRWEIEDACDRFKADPVLGPAARFLHAFQQEVDRHSDGWPYWSPPSRAARKLMDLLYRHQRNAYPQPAAPTAADVRRCLTPIKAFMTRRGTAAGMVLPPLSL